MSGADLPCARPSAASSASSAVPMLADSLSTMWIALLGQHLARATLALVDASPTACAPTPTQTISSHAVLEQPLRRLRESAR